jgi:signal transduction histidine kinase
VTVQDDGAGIDTVPEHGGFGLTGMTERAALVGGSLRLESEPGRGTTVHATFPVECLH